MIFLQELKPDAATGAGLPVEGAGSDDPERTTIGGRLKELAQKPRRHPAIHWAALVLSIVSVAPLIIWKIWPVNFAGSNWYTWDIGFSIFFILEYITRSGFRWDPVGYTRTHIFDFVAIVPALVLVRFEVPFFIVWFWIIFAARVIRAFDRVMGDGFIPRNILALVEGFEEEITDRVMLRILYRLRDDMSKGRFGHGIGQAIEDNKESVLKEIRSQHPRLVENDVARFTGVTRALERAEENVYDSIVKILKSPEIDKTIRDSVNTTFSSIEEQLKEKSWKKNIGIMRQKKK